LERIVLTQDEQGQAAKLFLDKARVLQRVRQLSIPFTQIEDPTTYTEKLRTDIQAALPVPVTSQPTVFTGNKGSELNQWLQSQPAPRHVILQATQLQLDEALQLSADTTLEGRNATLIAETPLTPAAVVISGNNIVVNDLTVKTPGLGMRVVDAQNVILRDLKFTNMERGISIGNNSQFIELDRIMITDSKAGMSIQQDVSHVWLHHSVIRNSLRADNGGAGLLVSDAQPHEILEESTHAAALTEALYPPAPAPHALLIENNEFSHNIAQGIYFDGVYGSVLRANQITDNDKEGICLDFGSANNILMENNFINNGRRARQSDQDLTNDLVMNFGRLADGSAVSKLPGIALDNAAQNIVLWNVIRDNSGDGIKIVRTGIRNLFLFNTIISNNQGNNSRLHFFGILLGSAGLEVDINPANHPLDFLPPLENIVAGNSIYGEHWAAILLDHEAAFNDIYDNIAHHFTQTTLESASQRHNSIVGNSWQPPNAPPAQPLWRKLKTCLRRFVPWWECL
jgi:parallel beta-helix repeat protein